MLALPRSALAFVGRHATIAYALSIVLGLGLPQLASALRPFIPISIFVFIMLAFARANLPGLKVVATHPARLAGALAISAVAPPLVALAYLTSPLAADIDPALRLGIALMAAAPPLMASPVYAQLLGFENSLALTVLVIGMAIAPLTAPVIATYLAGAEVPITPVQLAQRLALFIGGGMICGLILRRWAGVPRLTALKCELDGVGVLMFFLFAIAAMDGVIDETLARPLFMLKLLALSTILAMITFLVGYLGLRGLGFNDRFSVSICVGLRNMGLLITPILSIAPKTTFLYFALAQIPVYVAPLMLRAAKRLLEPKR
jgi:BASS family bile acid:Na+ symporter